MVKSSVLALLALGLAAGAANAQSDSATLTRVDLHSVSIDRDAATRDFSSDDTYFREKTFAVAPGGWTGSVGLHTSPGAHAIDPDEVNSAVATQFGSSDHTVGAAFGVKF